MWMGFPKRKCFFLVLPRDKIFFLKMNKNKIKKNSKKILKIIFLKFMRKTSYPWILLHSYYFKYSPLIPPKKFPIPRIKTEKLFPFKSSIPFKLLVEETTSCGHDPLLKSLLSRRPSRMSLYQCICLYIDYFSSTLTHMIFILPSFTHKNCLKQKRQLAIMSAARVKQEKAFFCCKKIHV